MIPIKITVFEKEETVWYRFIGSFYKPKLSLSLFPFLQGVYQSIRYIYW